MDIIVSTKQAAGFFGVTERQVSNWKKSGCPQEGYGKWNLREVFEWWQDNIMTSKFEEKDESISKAKSNYWTAKASREKRKDEEEAGNSFKKEDVAGQWAGRMAEVVSGLKALPMRLAPELEGKSQSDIRRLLNEAQLSLRNNYCRTGKFCLPSPKQDQKPAAAKKKKKPAAKRKPTKKPKK